jgi:hypothetical protein
VGSTQGKESISVGVVKIFNSSSTNVSNALGQTLCGLLHLLECIRLGDSGRTFFKNLLETALSRTVTPIQSNGISVLVPDNLDFKMASILNKAA